ncbi:hypothetical protein IAD21_00298 [Abditibacteriota bacterium]|nr:hypothetical protein IAD21_00298 [Abditibacteriota bacterium]
MMTHSSTSAIVRPFIGALALLLLHCALGQANTLALDFPVLRDGKPVPAIPITVRLFDPATGMMKPPLRLRTDESGRVVAKVEVASARERGLAEAAARRVPHDYLVIDVPNAPLVVAELEAFRPRAFRGLSQITLGAGAVLRGKVFRDKQGAADATVSLVSVNGLPLNDPKRSVETPQLTGKTLTDGTFTLRPLQLEGNAFAQENFRLSASAMATLEVNGHRLRAGSNELELEAANSAPNPQTSARLALSQTWTARGKVVNSLNNSPVSGVRVQALAESVWPIEPAVTNARGEWQLSGIPPRFELYAVATHPRFGLAWIQIGEKLSSIGTKERQAKQFSDLVLPMRPLTTANGHIIDASTGRAPSLVDKDWPAKPSLGALYEEGPTDSDYDRFARGSTTATVGADGTFNLPVPVGENEVWPHVPFYDPLERGLQIDVPSQGINNLVVKVRRSPYFVVRFEAKDADDLKNLYVLDITTNPEGVSHGSDTLPASHLWASSAEKWGEEMKVRIHYGKDHTFDTTFIASLDNWPQVVRVPSP